MNVHRYINHYHPGYLRRLGINALKVIGTAYQQYDAHKRFARVHGNLQNKDYMVRRKFNRRGIPPTPRSRAPSIPSVSMRSRSTISQRSRARTNRSRHSNVPLGPAANQFRMNLRRARRVRNPRAATALNRRYGGTFGRGYTQRISHFYGKSGVVSKQEWGNSLSDANAIYLGHGMATNYLVGHIARNIVKKIYTKAGLEPRDWADLPPFDGAEVHYIQFEWYTSPTSTDANLTDTANFVTGNQYKDLGDKVATTLRAIQAGNPTQPVRWAIATLFAVNAGQRYMKSQLNLQRVHMEFQFVSQLKIQNVTEASTGLGDNDDLVTNVEANPLIGKHYMRKDWKNGFDLHWRPGSKATWDGFYANQNTGIIETTATDANSSATYNETFDKPPPYFAFNATKGAPIKLAPGEIKTSFIDFRTHIMFQNFYDKVYKGLITTTSIYPVEFGQVKMVGLEKLLDSRLESDANVTIQYEVMQQLKSTMVEIRQSTLPYVDIL